MTPMSYIAQTIPGLEHIAWKEIRARLPQATKPQYRTVPGKNGMVLFQCPDALSSLSALRISEDVFALLLQERVHWGYEGLSEAYNAVLAASTIDRVVAEAELVAPRQRGRNAVKFRLITRLTGKQQPYHRFDLTQSLGKALEKRSRGRWRSVDSGEDFEIWASLLGQELILGARLSDASMRQREYKTEHVAASLRPTAAAAMVLLTEPSDNDVFLDPMCGAGTIMIERAVMARYRLLLAGDIDSNAIAATKVNVGRKHKPREMVLWDARRLPLTNASIDKIATNLPFGIQVSSKRALPGLYASALTEMERVLRTGGRAVLLAGSESVLEAALEKRSSLRLIQRIDLQILGQPSAIRIILRD